MASHKISIDGSEYEALAHLRDVTHEAVKLRLAAAEQRYAECLGINRDAVSRLAQQDLTIGALRREIEALRRGDAVDRAQPASLPVVRA